MKTVNLSTAPTQPLNTGLEGVGEVSLSWNSKSNWLSATGAIEFRLDELDESSTTGSRDSFVK